MLEYTNTDEFDKYETFGGKVRDKIYEETSCCTGTTHYSEVYYNGTFAVDYLKCYGGDCQISFFVYESQISIYVSHFHIFSLQNDRIVKFDFSSEDYFDSTAVNCKK